MSERPKTVCPAVEMRSVPFTRSVFARCAHPAGGTILAGIRPRLFHGAPAARPGPPAVERGYPDARAPMFHAPAPVEQGYPGSRFSTVLVRIVPWNYSNT